MRYRALDKNGDYSFGSGPAEFLINTPDCVSQAVKTRLALFAGEFFLDGTVGMPWNTQVLGENTRPLYDAAIQEQVLNTQGVLSIVSYYSVLSNRNLSVVFEISTVYGNVTVASIL
jgi:hypothetical protein